MTETLSRDFTRSDLVALRHDVGEFAARYGLTDLALHRFVVAAGELATNAIHHGGGSGRLEAWCMGDVLYCRVTDQGPGLPATYRQRSDPPSPRALNGRGLWLARCNTDTMTIESRSNGTTITITVTARTPAPA
jgi:anti-sigma regulatory factor (Ser/Thr protein kinase)